VNNVEVTDRAGVHHVLMARFPRAKVAIWTGVVIVVILGLSWLIPWYYNLREWWWPWVVVLANALIFGWYLALLLITAVRGGSFALTPTGVLIQTGLSSVLIPWTAVRAASEDTDESSNRLLRLSVRGDYKVPGWPWPAALSPVLIGSSKRKLCILAWWFQPVPLDWMVAIIGYLVTHPEARPGIGRTDPDEWLQDREPPES
jgi:hypothetical protein